jgi:hypothetical protein
VYHARRLTGLKKLTKQFVARHPQRNRAHASNACLRLWTALAERSGDSALTLANRAQKRRRASLAAAVQKSNVVIAAEYILDKLQRGIQAFPSRKQKRQLGRIIMLALETNERC